MVSPIGKALAKVEPPLVHIQLTLIAAKALSLVLSFTVNTRDQLKKECRTARTKLKPRINLHHIQPHANPTYLYKTLRPSSVIRAYGYDEFRYYSWLNEYWVYRKISSSLTEQDENWSYSSLERLSPDLLGIIPSTSTNPAMRLRKHVRIDPIISPFVIYEHRGFERSLS